MRSTQRNVVMEQRADIRQIVPFLRDVMKGTKGDGGGIYVNMIGPIHITQVDGSEEQNDGVVQIDGVIVSALPAPKEDPGPLLLRGMSAEQEPIDEKTLQKFEPIYNKLPENKLDATVRLVVETAHRQDNSPKSVAKALNCSLYKAKSIMCKFGLSS